jgi:hypothetical protein
MISQRHHGGMRLCGAEVRVPRGLICVCVCTATMFVGLAACNQDGGPELQPRTVSLDEFSRSTDARPAPATTAPTIAPPAATAAEASPAESGNAASVAPSPPIVAAARPLRPGDEAVVESVIGQVSGRPIFVDEFLAPIDDQLRREGERLNQAEFIQRAQVIIGRRLSEVVRNELFLAEAEASLTEQERMGLLAFLKDLQEKNIAERGGTIFGAERRIAEEREMTLQEFEEAQRNETLIRNLLYQRISPRVIVSWRDVQREYERRRSEFNPPARITLMRLRLSDADQKELIEQVKTRLAAGEDFDVVVQELGLAESVSILGGEPLTMGPGGVSDVPVADALKAGLAKLKGEPGETTEAIAGEGRTTWLHIDKIEQPPARTLFEVQEQLIAELRSRRETEELDKYVNSLFEKGIYDELEQMSRRVLAVALLRYAR